MKVLFSNVGSGDLAGVLQKLHSLASEKRHEIVQDAAEADVIVLCGSWSEGPPLLTAHPLFVEYPEKCAAFSEDDLYLPLLPGVYCSPQRGLSSTLGRVRSFSYVSRHAGVGNRHVRPLTRRKDLFFSFQGASTSFVRKRLYRLKTGRADTLIEDTSSYWHWNPSADRDDEQRRYAEVIARSHFVLCPRGAGTGSHRLFEVMSLGVAPVLLADDYPLPKGPDWDSFLIRVPEKQLQLLPEILERYADESEMRGRRAREEWLKWFSAEQEFNHIVEACHGTLQSSRAAFRLFRLLRPAMIFRHRSGRLARKSVRSLILKTFQAVDAPFPFALRGHDK
jgi:hypothetical protein